MRRRAKILGFLLMIVMVSSFATAFQKPAVQQADAPTQLVIGAQDVITASDAGGGALSAKAFLGLLAILVIVALIL